MIRNAKNNGFIFKFPKDFILPPVEIEYAQNLKIFPTVYKNINAYINSTIQSISFPGFRLQPSTQNQKGYTVPYRPGSVAEANINRDFIVKFKLGEAYLNYWIMYSQLSTHHNYLLQDVDVKFLGPFYIHYLDDAGHILVTQKLTEVQMVGIDDLVPSYADNGNESKSFSCTFTYGRLTVTPHPTDNGQPDEPQNYFIS